MPDMTQSDLSSAFDYRDRSLTNVLAANLARRPDSIALQDADTALSYQQVWDSAARIAGGLVAVGIREGDHVVTMLDNSLDYALTFVALAFMGAVSVPVNTMYKGTSLEHVIRDSGATSAVVEHKYLDALAGAAADSLDSVVVRGNPPRGSSGPPTWRVTPFGDLAHGPRVEPLPRNVWDPLLIGYTSGTTGLSKGVVISNGQAFQVADPTEIQGVSGADQVFYVVCPMFHITGTLGGLFASFITGGRSHIASSFSASAFIDDASRVGATSTLLVATMVDFLLRQPPRSSDSTNTLRNVYMVPLHPRVEEFNERFQVVTRTSYGSTETGCVLVTRDETGLQRRSCGRVRDGFEVRLVDEHDMEVPVGTAGQAIVRGDQPWLLGVSYVGNAEATAAVWRNGWFHTGDLLRRDHDGYFYFVDRQRDAIRRRGENISSMEVEREVVAHPEVVECAAVGVASDHMEQEVKIFVVRRPESTLTAEALMTFLVDKIPRYAVPRFVQFVDDLPRTATAKIRKEVLRAAPNDTAWDREMAGVVLLH